MIKIRAILSFCLSLNPLFLKTRCLSFRNRFYLIGNQKRPFEFIAVCSSQKVHAGLLVLLRAGHQLVQILRLFLI